MSEAYLESLKRSELDELELFYNPKTGKHVVEFNVLLSNWIVGGTFFLTLGLVAYLLILFYLKKHHDDYDSPIISAHTYSKEETVLPVIDNQIFLP